MYVNIPTFVSTVQPWVSEILTNYPKKHMSLLEYLNEMDLYPQT